MKIKVFTKLILFLTFSFFAVSCYEHNQPQYHSKTQSSADVVLDITTEFRGLNWINGEILDFRLYDDGFVEFDDYPLESNSGILKAEDVKVRKQTEISETGVKEIKDLIMSSDFLNLNEKYTKIVSSCDAVPLVTVKSKTKTIEIAWCDNLANPERSSEFPKVLSKLFTKIRIIKSQALGKQVFSP